MSQSLTGVNLKRYLEIVSNYGFHFSMIIRIDGAKGDVDAFEKSSLLGHWTHLRDGWKDIEKPRGTRVVDDGSIVMVEFEATS